MIKRKKTTKTRLLPMEELQARPCEVDGRPALFHRWVDESQMVRVDVVLYKMDVLHNTFALVEYQDGTIAKVKPEQIRFVGEV